MRWTAQLLKESFLCAVLLMAASTLVNSMTQTTVTSLFVCMGYGSRGVFHKSNPFVKAAKFHVN